MVPIEPVNSAYSRKQTFCSKAPLLCYQLFIFAWQTVAGSLPNALVLEHLVQTVCLPAQDCAESVTRRWINVSPLTACMWMAWTREGWVTDHSAACPRTAHPSHAHRSRECSSRPISVFWLWVLCCCPPLSILFQFHASTRSGPRQPLQSKKFLNKINGMKPQLHTPYVSNFCINKDIKYHRQVLRLRFCHYRAPVPVNGCKVSSSGNEILQSKRATRLSPVTLMCIFTVWCQMY